MDPGAAEGVDSEEGDLDPSGGVAIAGDRPADSGTSAAGTHAEAPRSREPVTRVGHDPAASSPGTSGDRA